MKKTLLLSFFVLLLHPVISQTLVWEDLRETALPRPKTFDHELGIRYGAQISLGSTDGPDLQAFCIDYAWYGPSNIGVRTGFNTFLDADIENYYSVPVQFTWRTKSYRAKEFRSSDRSHYYNHRYYRDEEYTPRSFFWDLICSILPSALEAHAGFTPGMMGGPRTLPEGYDPEWGWQPYVVRHRFACTFDAGFRLIIPIWRFNLFGDFTYHCYLTDNFRVGDYRPKRSFVGLSGGISFRF